MLDDPSLSAARCMEDGTESSVEQAGDKTISRRSLCVGLGGSVVLFGLGSLRFAGSVPLCRPPGGQEESRLVSACIRCEKCYEVCLRDVIVPAHIEDGFLGMRTPTLDFSENYCNFCTEENDGWPRCVEMCPTGALALETGLLPRIAFSALPLWTRRRVLPFAILGVGRVSMLAHTRP